MSFGKILRQVDKFINLLDSDKVFTTVERRHNSSYDNSIFIFAESKVFNIREDKLLKAYLYGRLTYEETNLKEYNTKFVLSQKDTEENKENIIYSMHFDGNIYEDSSNHPIFHMQFDNTLIREMKPDKAQEEYYVEPLGENRQIRIPTPQMDILTFIFYFFKTMDTESKLNEKFLENIKEKFFIDNIMHGYQSNISKLIFPS